MWNGVMFVGSCVGILFFVGMAVVAVKHIWDVCHSGVPDDVKRKAHDLE